MRWDYDGALWRRAGVGLVVRQIRAGEVSQSTPQFADLLGWVQVGGQYLHFKIT
jgi:hypothetical protein